MLKDMTTNLQIILYLKGSSKIVNISSCLLLIADKVVGPTHPPEVVCYLAKFDGALGPLNG